ncbi:MAG: hypothetical protein H7A23_26110 [Leptospiraceae bacterium]|nr:hypothetical protein [Leptospiraceae bacterium]MCP5498045.1 hypothetical protein [Leptospiraceae bacterium]
MKSRKVTAVILNAELFSEFIKKYHSHLGCEFTGWKPVVLSENQTDSCIFIRATTGLPLRNPSIISA